MENPEKDPTDPNTIFEELTGINTDEQVDSHIADEEIPDKKHLVIALGGGPLGLFYGTPYASPVILAEKIYNTYKASGASSIEFICVDPHTDAPWTEDLTHDEMGFEDPDFYGPECPGFNAKEYAYSDKKVAALAKKLTDKNLSGEEIEEYLSGKAILSFHDYCGSASTNLRKGEWMEKIPQEFYNAAIKAFNMLNEGYELGLEVIENNYWKDVREGTVDQELQDKTWTPYAEKAINELKSGDCKWINYGE